MYCFKPCTAAGDIVQLDISDPYNIRAVGRVFTGGLIRKVLYRCHTTVLLPSRHHCTAVPQHSVLHRTSLPAA